MEKLNQKHFKDTKILVKHNKTNQQNKQPNIETAQRTTYKLDL